MAICIIMACLISLAMSNAAMAIGVHDNNGVVYPSIQEGVNGVNSGDTLLVDSGTYYEHVIVNKSIILKGVNIGEGMPVVDGQGAGSPFSLEADGITLENFDVIGAGTIPAAGVLVVSSNNVLNRIVARNQEYGIYLFQSSGNMLSGSEASSNQAAGIVLEQSNNNILTNNNVSYNTPNGIEVTNSIANTLSDNMVVGNRLAGIEISTSDSNSTTISGNNVFGNTWGIVIWSSNNQVTGNNASYNDYGIYVICSIDNVIARNNMIGNIVSGAYDTGGECVKANQWDNGAQGNYYSDNPSCPDNDDNGICDVPYAIPGDLGSSGTDNFPLVKPYSGLNAPTEIIIVNPADGGNKLLNELSTVEYTVVDPDGIKSVTPTTLNGLSLDTGTVGLNEFKIVVVDGLDTAVDKTVTYNVLYRKQSYLPPENILSVGKKAVLPIKVGVWDAYYSPVPNAIVDISVSPIIDGSLGLEEPGVSSERGVLGSLAKYNSKNKIYSFKLDLRSKSVGLYQVNIRFDDGTSLYATVSIIYGGKK